MISLEPAVIAKSEIVLDVCSNDRDRFVIRFSQQNR